jgi:hypothetical protein
LASAPYDPFTIVSRLNDNSCNVLVDSGVVKTILFALALAAAWALEVRVPSSPASHCTGASTSDVPEVLALDAVSPDETIASAAIRKLRALGPTGLEALLKTHANDLAQAFSRGGVSSKSTAPCDDGARERLTTAIDAVSGQCDACASGLYWFTDFEQAKAAAKEAGKPILSLRLLGKLNDDYSCANSRFFRTTLYSNSDISKYLREHFILHWQSVRPVPRLTIDFGDGRKLERTITGNSVHYVLDRDGQPVDALPGLYGPKAFLRVLTEAETAAIVCAKSSRGARPSLLRQYHLRCRTATNRQLQADLAKLSLSDTALDERGAPGTNIVPTARMAGTLAVSKSAVELPVLRLLQPKSGTSPAPMRGELDDAVWSRLAMLHTEEAKLDDMSRTVVASKNPKVFAASELARSKRLVENPLLTTLRNLERSISEDSVRNEYLLHARIHEWFIESAVPGDLAGLNAKVYAELFLMPENDPWLGLAPDNTFTALPEEGLIGMNR